MRGVGEKAEASAAQHASIAPRNALPFAAPVLPRVRLSRGTD